MRDHRKSEQQRRETGGAPRASMPWILLLFVAALHLLVLCEGITRPWLQGHEGTNGAGTALGARNVLRYGVVATRLGWFLDAGETPDGPRIPYVNHPPLLTNLVALSFAVFGVHEWAARLVAVGFSVASVFLVFLCARIVLSPWGSLGAAAIYSAFPMAMHYGHMACHEPVTVAFILYAVWQAMEHLRSAPPGALARCLAGLSLAQLSGWPGFFCAAGFIGVAALLAGRSAPARRLAVGATLTSALVLGFIVLHAYLVSGSLDAPLERLAKRVGMTDEDPFTVIELAHRVAWRSGRLFTRQFCLLALAGLAVFAARRDLRRHWPLLALLAAPPVLHTAVFSEGAWVHEYWFYYQGPLLAVLAAVAVEGAFSLVRPGWRRLATGLCFLALGSGLATAVGTWQGLQQSPLEPYEAIRAVRPRVAAIGQYTMVGFASQVAYYLDVPYILLEGVPEARHCLQTARPGAVVSVYFRYYEALGDEPSRLGYQVLTPSSPYGHLILWRPDPGTHVPAETTLRGG